MPVNFNLLRQAGPANFAEGLMQGQEESRKNALVQQQAAENQQLNALRMQQSRGAIAEQEATAQRNRRTEKAGMFRERLLRAATPDAARQLVIAQYNDPDLAPVLSQAGSLEQALAEVSDDPAAFEQYKQQEAMGMGEWIKSQAPKVIGNALVKPSGEVLYKAPEPMAGDAATMRQLGYPLTPEGYASFRNAQRQERMLSPEEEAQRVRIAQAGRSTSAAAGMPKAPSGYRYTPTGDLEPIPGGPATKPSAAVEKAQVAQKQLTKDLDSAISELADITKEGGLIDQSTGSGAGRLVDIGAGFFGSATPGAIAIGKLQPIADTALKMVPRFEGPQSDADTRSYKEAAGQLANPSLPTEIRKAAGKTVMRLMQKRKDQFTVPGMETEKAPAAKAGEWKDL